MLEMEMDLSDVQILILRILSENARKKLTAQLIFERCETISTLECAIKECFLLHKKGFVTRQVIYGEYEKSLLYSISDKGRLILKNEISSDKSKCKSPLKDFHGVYSPASWGFYLNPAPALQS